MLLRVGRKIKHSIRYIAALVLLGLLFVVTSIYATRLLGGITSNTVFLQSGNTGLLWRCALAFISECGLEYAFYVVRGFFSSHGRRCLQEQCAISLMEAPLSWLSRKDSGDILGRLQLELQATTEWICEMFPEMLLQFMRMLFFSAMMIFLSWKLALMYLGAVILVAIFQIPLSRPIQSKTEEVQQRRAYANSLAREIITHRVTIKAYDAQALVLRWYRQRLKPWLNLTWRTEMLSSPLRTLGWVCGMLPIFALCIMGAYMVQSGEIPFGTFMSIYFLADLMLNDCLHYVDLFVQYRKGQASAVRLFEILEVPSEAARMQSLPLDQAEKPILCFENVSFSYDGDGDQGEKWTVQDISFRVKPGEKVAFVGSSGCGKTTILRLAEGLFLPQKGKILYGDLEQNKAVTTADWGKLSVVPQEPFMFSDSVKNNIILDRATPIPDKERQALYHSTTVDTFLGLLSDGEETLIGEGGVSLSLGQQQRVAVARGLAKDAPLLLLDEATSALDAQSDEQVTRAILDAKNIAVLDVTHRLTYLKEFDAIYVMEDGRIAEHGAHSDLLAAGGAYTRLLETQTEARR